MAKFCGALFLLKIAHPSTPDTWLEIGGIQANSISINSEFVDVTDKSSGGWREGKPECGITSMSASGNGFVTDSAGFVELQAKALAKVATNFQIISESGEEFEGPFHITTCERGGEHNNAETFSVSLENTAEIEYTPAS